MGRLLPLLIVFVLLCVQLEYGSCRVLQTENEELMKKMNNVRVEALPKGDVPPSGPSGCTYIPGTGGSNCPIGAKHFAGGASSHAAATAPAYPRRMVSFGVATINQK